jgi:hypothetical protein
VDIDLDAALSCLAALDLIADLQAFFTQLLDRQLNIAAGLLEDILAVLNPCAGALTQLFYHLGGNDSQCLAPHLT